MSNLVTSASRRSAALNPARKPGPTDWRARLAAVPMRIKVAAIVTVLLAGLAWLGISSHQQATQPVKLFATGLSKRQLEECSTQLAKWGVQNRPSPEGDNLLVAPNLQMAILNRLSMLQMPHPDPSQAQSSFSVPRRELLARQQAELQLSLAATLRTMQGVSNASVQLAVPDEAGAFVENNRPTASVVLELQSGYEMSRSQASGIAKFVASAVPFLRAEDVTVLDQTGREQAHGNGEGDQLDSIQFELQKQLEQHLQAKAQRMLDMAYGRGNALAVVNVQLDFSQLEVRNNTGSSQPVVKNKSEETYSSPEVTTTIMGEEDAPGGADPKRAKVYKKLVEAVRCHADEALTWRVYKLPRMERVTCAVLISQQSQRDNAMQMVKGAIGLDDSRGDEITASVVPLHRENAGLKSLEATPLPPAQSPSADPVGWLGLLAAGALGVGIWIVGQRRVKLNQPVLETPKFNGMATQCDLNYPRDGSGPASVVETATQPRVLEKLEALARQSPKETASMLRSFMDTNTMN
ncbi:MAG: flagellar M-ring protein FliF C-terminal domain-containing protein [Vulcanimicrobiota bacterium]